MDNQEPSYTLLVGNPGAGKSTLLNGLLKQPLFESGVSVGGGLTQVLQVQEYPPNSKKFWGDTPGLSDTKLREKAAREIEAGMKQNGNYRILFVVTLRSGRVSPADAATIRLVLEAIPKEVPYAIIVNKLTSKIFTLLLDENSPQREKIYLSLIPEGRETPYFYPVLKDPRIHDQNNQMPQKQTIEDIEKILKLIPYASLYERNVSTIKSDTFEKTKAKLKELQIENEQSQELYQKRIKEIQEQSQKFAEQIQQTEIHNQQLRDALRKSKKVRCVIF